MTEESTFPNLATTADLAIITDVASTLHQAMEWLVHVVHLLGYPGIFIMTFLESTFVPIPSEVTMIPVGYLIHRGDMHWLPALICSITGTLAGSAANYVIAYHYGRRFLHAYGKYMLFGHDKMEKLDKFFASHGEISIFTGRLIPGVRHVISFPAGLAHMNFKKFCLYTTTGGAIWMITLMGVGYFIGGNEEKIHHYMPYVTAAALTVVVTLIAAYFIRHRKGVKHDVA